MSFKLEIEPEWNMIKKIKEHIRSDAYITTKGRDFEDAVLLTAIELVENALKYSDGEEETPVLFELLIDENNCRIQVTNTCKKQSHRDALKAAIVKLIESDPFQLYVERLEQLRDNPDGFSRMGLIRIVYEAEFKLEAKFEQDQVTIMANCKKDESFAKS